MAEELGERAADALASFTTWDGDGRRRLDGMSKGRRWDIDREQRAWERDNRADLRRLYKSLWLARWRRAHPELARKVWASWYAAHKDEVAPANRARAKRWYHANRERAAARDSTPAKVAARRRRANLAYQAERGLAIRHRPCGLCRQPGHNRRTCGERR
jgi:hypothetical protein